MVDEKMEFFVVPLCPKRKVKLAGTWWKRGVNYTLSMNFIANITDQLRACTSINKEDGVDK